jgi:tyrosinase
MRRMGERTAMTGASVLVRRNVWTLPAGDRTVQDYAKAVAVMMARPASDPTSWSYQAAMHGTHATQTRTLFNECKHGTWFFLPWHRMFIYYFERIVRAAVVEAGGSAHWTLPFWDYEAGGQQATLPVAFRPTGGTNPLSVTRAHGINHGQALSRAVTSAKHALACKSYVGTTEFGGGITGLGQMSGQYGQLESQPHNLVHDAVGGRQGIMSDPLAAAGDPIFWLHHANIDRLWEVWLKRRPGHLNPTHDSAWMQGPDGARPFVMPEPDNKTRTTFHPSEMLDTTTSRLDYVYEDIRDPFPGADRVARRMEHLRLKMLLTAEPATAKEPQVELVGCGPEAVHLTGPETAARVRFDPTASHKILRSFQANELAARGASEPDRIFLNLENITGSSDATSFKVYVDLKLDAALQEQPENLAGIVTLFGLNEACAPDRQRGGNGLNKVLEITKVIDRFHLGGLRDLNEITLRFILRHGRESDVSIGRISLYRQGE